LPHHITTNHDASFKKIDMQSRLTQEYQTLSRLQQKTKLHFITSTLPQNKPKNRYPNILTLETTRVPISCKRCNNNEGHHDEHEDYINANFVSSPTKNRFIACQAPLPSTIDSFWKMIWEHGVRMILMLTKCCENGVVKSEKYYPDEYEKLKVDDMTIVCQSMQEGRLKIRELVVKKMMEERTIYHIQYCDWVDLGVPEEVEDIFKMVQIVGNGFQLFDAPIVCHCSAGVGRTGTFISIFNCIADLRMYGKCDVYNTVKLLREERFGCITREEQYIFVYKAISEFINRCKMNNSSI